MELGDYLLRSIDYIPIVSIFKGIYYINKSNERDKVITRIVANILSEKNKGILSEERADALIKYAEIDRTKAMAIHFRGLLTLIPIFGNLLVAIHDIRGQFITGGYLDSMKGMSEFNKNVKLV